MEDSIPLKRCSKCKQYKIRECFPSNRSQSDGLNNWCKECCREKQRLTYRPKKQPDDSPDGYRRCKKCGEIKEATLANFYKDTTVTCGLQSTCITCRKVANHLNYIEHQEERKEQHREYGILNKMQLIDYHKQWYKTNRDRVLGRQKQYNASHPEGKRLYWKLYSQQEYVKHHRRTQWQNRRARLKGVHTSQDIRDQYKRQKGKCYYCHKKIKWGTHHIEHTYPISRENGDELINSKSYLVIACRTCNLKKGNKYPWEWPEGGRLL